MRVSTKLGLAFGLLVSLVVAMLVYHVSVIQEVARLNRDLSAVTVRLALSSTDQLGQLDDLEENASKYLVTGDEGYLEAYRRSRRAFTGSLQQLRDLPLTGDEQVEVELLSGLWNAFLRTVSLGASADSLAADGDLSARLADVANEVEPLRRQTLRVSQASQLAMAATVELSTAAARRASRMSGGAGVAAALAAVLLALIIVRSISERLGQLKRGAQGVAEGDFSVRVDTQGSDEFSEVAQTFNAMTERLGELDRMKRDFLSQVSHDLKTPLASIHETNQLLLDQLPGELNEKQRHLLRLTTRSADRLSIMIGKLLDMARLDAGAIEYEFREHEVGALIRAAVLEIISQAADRGLRIETELPNRAVHIECDGDRVTQVVINLLENAVKFSDPGSRVVVRVECLDGGAFQLATPSTRERGGEVARISVLDRGPGIPSADKRRIFDRFHQAASAGRDTERGVGLGLAICREIATAHAGEVQVTDRSGGGSVFSLLIPNARTEWAEAELARTGT
jgi:two-component system sensor histidine kinase GlrK